MFQHETRIGDHEDPGKQEHGPQTNQPVGKHGHHGLGLFVMGFPGSIISLHEVATGGAQEK